MDGPFWAGLPMGPAHAVVGWSPYLTVWPDRFEGKSDGPVFLSTDEWGGAVDVWDLMGGVPTELVDTREVREDGGGWIGREYPGVWPFRSMA